MFFNYDSLAQIQMPLPVVVVTCILGGLIAYSSFSTYNIFTTQSINESLVNTVPNIVNVASQANSTIIPSENTIPIPIPDPTTVPTPQYVDVGVQTDVTSIWLTIKNWFMNAFSIGSTDVGSIGYNNVQNWRNNLDSVQEVSLHDSEGPLSSIVNTHESELVPSESASNIGDITTAITNTVIDYSQYTVIGEVLVETATNEAYIQSVNAVLAALG